jgi:signal transduction histidine kinase
VLGVLIATLLGFVGSTWYAQHVASAVDAAALSIATNASPAIEHLAAARGEVVRIVMVTASGALAADQPARPTIDDHSAIEAALSRLREELSAYAALPFYAREDRRYAQAQRALGALEAELGALAADATPGGRAIATARSRVLLAAQRLDLAIQELVTLNAREQHRMAVEIPRQRRLAHRAGSMLQIACATLGLLLMALVIRGIREYGRLLATGQRVRDDLLATVTHDLRNPINAIKLSTQLLHRRLKDPSADQHVMRIDRAADRVTRLIDDLLDAAKLEEGAMRITRHPEDAGALIESMAEMFRIIAAEKKIELATKAPTTSVTVPCERHLILRVLANLVGNAIKFSPEGSSILVACEAEEARVRFSVVDHGPGIPPDYVSHAFERYWQQGAGDRRGSGLGLYIAKGIVEAHGGKIWIESVLQKGTTVHFVLPRDGG